jgi:hypothetical protein
MALDGLPDLALPAGGPPLHQLVPVRRVVWAGIPGVGVGHVFTVLVVQRRAAVAELP